MDELAGHLESVAEEPSQLLAPLCRRPIRGGLVIRLGQPQTMTDMLASAQHFGSGCPLA